MSDLTVVTGAAINADLVTSLREATSLIADLRNELAGRNTQLAARESQVRRLTATLVERESLIASLKATHADLQRDLISAVTHQQSHGDAIAISPTEVVIDIESTYGCVGSTSGR